MKRTEGELEGFAVSVETAPSLDVAVFELIGFDLGFFCYRKRPAPREERWTCTVGRETVYGFQVTSAGTTGPTARAAAVAAFEGLNADLIGDIRLHAKRAEPKKDHFDP